MTNGQRLDVARIPFFESDSSALKIYDDLVALISHHFDENSKILDHGRRLRSIVDEAAQSTDVENDTSAASRVTLQSKLP